MPRKKWTYPPNILWVFLLLIGISSAADAQVIQAKTLTLRKFLDQVRTNHPISQQSALLQHKAAQQTQIAKGAFDPKFKTDFNLKNYKALEYYDILKSKITIPTWYNIDFNIVYEASEGVFLNPERNVPEEGLINTGLSIPIGRGLLTDSRRTGLRQAKLGNTSLSLQARLMLNDLLANAGKAYWEWFAYYQKQALAQQAYQLAKDRFEIVRQKVTNGDAASVDTIEYGIQLQNRNLDAQKARLDYQNARLKMDSYYWDGDTVSTFQDQNLIPDVQALRSTALADADTYLSMAAAHPSIQQLNLKSQSLDLDRALAFENIKPKLDLSYSYLFSAKGFPEVTFARADDHKILLNISTSLLLRKERAKYQLSKLKQRDNELKTQYKRRVIENKIYQAYNKLETYQELLQLQQQNLLRYQKMMDAETARFFNGDSDVFRVNYRENKLLEARAKVIDYQKDTRIAYLKLLWTTGTLVDY